jgi:hypothetical protein
VGSVRLAWLASRSPQAADPQEFLYLISLTGGKNWHFLREKNE